MLEIDLGQVTIKHKLFVFIYMSDCELLKIIFKRFHAASVYLASADFPRKANN